MLTALADASTVCIIGLANHSALVFLRMSHSNLTPVSRQIFPSPAYFRIGSCCLLLLLFASADHTWSRKLLTLTLLFSLWPFLHSSSLHPHLPEVSGGSREVTASCLPGPAVCFSNEPETVGGVGGQPIMEMRKSRQAGRCRTTLIAGSLFSSTLPSYLSLFLS